MVTIRITEKGSPDMSREAPRSLFQHTFENDLQTSGPYLHAERRRTVHSTTSSTIHTKDWSFFSGLSVARVSQISVINLAYSLSEIWNGWHYLAQKELSSMQTENREFEAISSSATHLNKLDFVNCDHNANQRETSSLEPVGILLLGIDYSDYF